MRAATDLARRSLPWAAGACAFDRVARYVCDQRIDTDLQKDAWDSFPRKESWWVESTTLSQAARLLAAESNWELSNAGGREEELCAAVCREVGFSVRCAPSRLADGGDGIFAVGTIPKGRVVTLYAGTCVSQWDSIFYGIVKTLLPWAGTGSDYMLRQADQSVLDGSMYTALAQRSERGYVSPSSCGQLINHAGAGMVPNVAPLTTYMSPNNAFARFPVHSLWGWLSGKPAVVTLMVSLVEIHDGEEMFWDYDYGGSPEDYPAWYTPCGTSSSMDAKRPPLRMKDYLELEEGR
eukprot:TRINITY_DN12077_c0_g1_i1.p1 TRINITY_DN12077_c0_g1~~TRINITY_DN12077_c0_g1_i1.p1  ORF type:complete len:293 (+),score=23.48 TRINITY_DN12077_c0_g1_i1:75-953(+)